MENGIDPIIEIDEKVRDIIADENAVNRIFANLINNVLKHGESFVKITLKEDGNKIVTEFINGAPDLSEEDVEKIFERFYRVDKTRDRKTGGTGLGLSITHSTVLMHNGSIKVLSKENEGSTFLVRIPLKHNKDY